MMSFQEQEAYYQNLADLTQKREKELAEFDAALEIKKVELKKAQDDSKAAINSERGKLDNEINAIEAQKFELSVKLTEVDDKCKLLEGLESQLRDKLAQFDRDMVSFNEKQAINTHKEADLRARVIAFEFEKDKLDESKRQLKVGEDDLDGRLKMFDKQVADFVQKSLELDKKVKELADKLSGIDIQTNNLEVIRAALSKKERELQDNAVQISAKEKVLMDKELVLAGLLQEIDKRGEAVAIADKNVAAAAKEQEFKSAELAYWEKELKARNLQNQVLN